MKYWNDPLHFTLEMGRHIQLSLSDTRDVDTPPNFMVQMVPDSVFAHISQRRNAVRKWAATQEQFVERFQEARGKWERTH